MAAVSLNAGVPSGPVLDEAGNLSAAWRLFFISLYNRTGGAIGVGTADVNAAATAAQTAADTAQTAANTANTAATGAASSVATEATTRAGADAVLQAQLTPGQFAGTITNDNAAAGKVGEYISNTVLSGAAVSLTSGTIADVTSIALTHGDWDVWGDVSFLAGGTTTIASLAGWVNTVSATTPTGSGGGAYASLLTGWTTGGSQSFPVGRRRVSIAATTTVYLSVVASFGVSTLGGFGFIGARRVR